MVKSKEKLDDYMTIGEVVKKMGVTKRTLQYYDYEGILKPSGQSEGGRRLYSHKDLVRLHQINSMKYLGFSLAEIKDKLPAIDTPKEISDLLTHQAIEVREKIKSLVDVLESIEGLNREVLRMNEVDWRKYADITGALINKNSSSWMIKYLDSETNEQMSKAWGGTIHDKSVIKEQNKMMKIAAKLQKEGIDPTSEKAQKFALQYWNHILKATEKDPSLLTKLMEFGEKIDDSEWKEHYDFDKDYLKNILGFYLETNQIELYNGGNES